MALAPGKGALSKECYHWRSWKGEIYPYLQNGHSLQWLRQLRVCLQRWRPGFNPWVRKIMEEGSGKALQYSYLENPMDLEEPIGLQSRVSQRVGHDWEIFTCGFFSSHVRMWELDHKEDWGPKSWCFQIVVVEKTSPLDYKDIKPVNS